MTSRSTKYLSLVCRFGLLAVVLLVAEISTCHAQIVAAKDDALKGPFDAFCTPACG